MLNALISERIKLVQGIAPNADVFAGDPASDVVKLTDFQKAAIIVELGAGATGTATLTVEACSAAAGSGNEAIPFKYRRRASGDTLGDITDATVAGFTTTAGGGDTYVLEVDAKDLPEGKPWIRLQTEEVVDSAVIGGVLILLAGGHESEDLPTVIA